jgi:hypothetical protein
MLDIAEQFGSWQAANSKSDVPFKFVLNLVDKNSMREYAPANSQHSANPFFTRGPGPLALASGAVGTAAAS